MFNYVCAVDVYKKDETFPYAIKVGVTEDCDKRFVQICKQVENEEMFLIDCASVLPLFIVGGNYDRYVAERVEDVLRLYYLRKLGYHRGYKQDWINAKNLPHNYDIEAEEADLKAMLKDWFPNVDFKIFYEGHKIADPNKELIFSSFYNKIQHLYD